MGNDFNLIVKHTFIFQVLLLSLLYLSFARKTYFWNNANDKFIDFISFYLSFVGIVDLSNAMTFENFSYSSDDSIACNQFFFNLVVKIPKTREIFRSDENYARYISHSPYCTNHTTCTIAMNRNPLIIRIQRSIITNSLNMLQKLCLDQNHIMMDDGVRAYVFFHSLWNIRSVCGTWFQNTMLNRICVEHTQFPYYLIWLAITIDFIADFRISTQFEPLLSCC